VRSWTPPGIRIHATWHAEFDCQHRRAHRAGRDPSIRPAHTEADYAAHIMKPFRSIQRPPGSSSQISSTLINPRPWSVWWQRSVTSRTTELIDDTFPIGAATALGSPHGRPASTRSVAHYSKSGSPTPDMQVVSGFLVGSSTKAWNILVAQ
jgi:hypothetical protein